MLYHQNTANTHQTLISEWMKFLFKITFVGERNKLQYIVSYPIGLSK